MMDDNITVVITTSPCRRHPSTEMIRKTIEMIRIQIDSPILILIDGIKPEQEYLSVEYEKYKKELQEWIITQDRIDCLVFVDFQHQTGMIKEGIKYVNTPQLLFIEHDFPIRGNIPWQDISDIIRAGAVDLVRFSWEPQLIPEHKHMFLDKTPIDIGGVPLVRVGQWSQRPHLTSVDFYKKIIKDYLDDDRKTYIEDAIHGHYGDISARGWGLNKLCIYHPTRGSISRCEHLDGRMEEAKYGL